jgi:signal transduction histidine kinase
MPSLPLWLRGRVARRLALAITTAAVAAAALTAIVVNLAFGQRFADYLDTQQQARAQQVVTLLAADYQTDQGWRTESLDRLAPGLVMSGDTVELLAPGGRTIWSLADAGVDPAMTVMHRTMMGTPELAPSVRGAIMVDGREVATAVLAVPRAAAPAADRDFRDAVNGLLLAAGLGAGAVALLAGLFLARRTTRPLAELTAAADELAAGVRDRRAHVSSRDEIGQLARSFNTMADALDREDELRRAFAADIAHELRTPLTILQGQLEAVRDGITPADEQLITSLHEESRRMTRLVADLETMADAGAAGFTLQRSQVALRPLIAAAVDRLAAHAAQRGVRLVALLEEATVAADPVRISQVVTNLLSNAATYTPPGGTITVTLARSTDGAELAVADTGSGIPDDELPRVFDRFFRGAGAPPGGSGIGLAVAAELVAAHGGTLTAQSGPRCGSRFLVRLPATAPGRAPHSQDLHHLALASNTSAEIVGSTTTSRR